MPQVKPNPAELVENLPASFASIDSVEQLQEFENSLNNVEFARAAVSLYSIFYTHKTNNFVFLSSHTNFFVTYSRKLN